MKELIVNADDFGQDEDTFTWTVKGFEAGKVTSATIMAGMPFTKQAVEYAKAHPQFSFGIHLYFSDEKPISQAKDIPSMIDPTTGKLWVTRQFILRQLTGRIKLRDLKHEICAQIESLRALGLQISHVDGHGHLHRLPLSLLALMNLRKKLGILTIRRTQNVYGAPVSFAARVFNWVMEIPLALFFKRANSFLMTANKIDESQKTWFSDALKKPWKGVLEIGVHPGSQEAWRVLDCQDMFDVPYSNDIKLTNYNYV